MPRRTAARSLNNETKDKEIHTFYRMYAFAHPYDNLIMACVLCFIVLFIARELVQGRPVRALGDA